MSKIAFGGDYNPEQWPEEVWKDDYRLFDAAAIDTVTVGVFTWALTQPGEDVYDFTTLDTIIGRAAAEGRSICLATGTGAHPAWLARAHPDVTRTDFQGRKHRFGQRHNSCPSSPAFRPLSAAVAGRIAGRYAGNPAVVAWHVGNEYGGACYCELCGRGFRAWLQAKYGTLEALTHDLMRGLTGGQPFWLMEQTPSVTACRDVNPLKRPGVMRLWSWPGRTSTSCR